MDVRGPDKLTPKNKEADVRAVPFVSALLVCAALASEAAAQTQAPPPENQRDGWRPRLGVLGGFMQEHFSGDAENPERDLLQSFAGVAGGTEYVPVASRRVRLSVSLIGAANFRQRTFERRAAGEAAQGFSGSAVGLSAEAGVQVSVRSGGALDYTAGADATLMHDSGNVERDSAPAGARGLELEISGHRISGNAGVNLRRRATIGVVGEYSRLESHLTVPSGGSGTGRPPTASPPPPPDAKSAVRFGPHLSVRFTDRLSADARLLFSNGRRFQIVGRYGLW